MIADLMVSPTEYRLVRTDAQADPDTRGDASLHEDLRRYCGLVWFPNLDTDKDGDEDSREYKA